MGMSPLPDHEVALPPATSPPTGGFDGGDQDVVDVAEREPGLRALRRVRTLARLRRAGLSEDTLTILLPDWVPHVEQLQASVEPTVEIVLPD